jgi:hypothetical protein
VSSEHSGPFPNTALARSVAHSHCAQLRLILFFLFPSPCELSTLPFLSDFMAISGKGRFIGVLVPLLEWGLSGDGCEMADGVGGWANESRWGGMYGELG